MTKATHFLLFGLLVLSVANALPLDEEEANSQLEQDELEEDRAMQEEENREEDEFDEDRETPGMGKYTKDSKTLQWER